MDHLASHENTIAEEVTKIMKEMEPSSDVAISIKEIDAVLASKKGKKKFSEEDLKRLQEQKTLLERAKATLEPILNKPYFELDQSLISNLSQQISVVGILIDEIPNLLLKCEIKARTREIILSIQDQASIMCEDNPNTSQGLKNTVEAAIMSSTGKISMETILENKNRVREIVKKLKIRDENLKHGLERVESLQWMNEAYGLLSKEKVSEKLLDDHLNGASDSVQISFMVGEANRCVR